MLLVILSAPSPLSLIKPPTTLAGALREAPPPPLGRSLTRIGHVRRVSHLVAAQKPRTLPFSSPAAVDREAPGQAEIPPPPPLQRESLPRHVAIIMDGNSRWASARGLPASVGHEAGYRALRNILELSGKWGIGVVTVFAFSSENWRRPKTEVDFLMKLFQGVLKESMQDFVREGIRVCMIGDPSKLPNSLQNLISEVEEITRNNSRLVLIVAISYGGRSDIALACQKIAKKVKHGLLEPSDVTESLIAEELGTNQVPYPDLLIRTSGELRLSNFLLWESAYTELYFAKAHWPDFGEAEYVEALTSFQNRQRRFGLRTAKE